MANSCNRLSLLVELSNKVQNLLTQPQLLGALSAWDDEQVEICCVCLVYREGRLDRVPLLPFYRCPFSPTTTVLTPSSCRRYIGWKSSKSSKSSAAMMAALFPFRASTISCPLP